MKYKPKQYAAALAEAMLKPGADGKKIADNFLEFLKRSGDMKKAKEIISLAENLFVKKTGRRKVVIETARKIKPEQKGLLASVAQKGDIVSEKINKDLIAGIKIIINDEQLDMSMQRKIQNIFR